MELIEFARMGGKAVAKKRFKGKTKKQISQIMSDVRNKKKLKKP